MSAKKTKNFEKGCQAKKNLGEIFFWFLWLRRLSLRGLNAARLNGFAVSGFECLRRFKLFLGFGVPYRAEIQQIYSNSTNRFV